jgi:predicted AlkP superfamily phosphohydrolase/phosphomutase
MPIMARFLLIGLDGFEPSLAERWMAEGRLPNLAALAARGSYLPCESVTPPATFPAWTTCVTGVNPGKHGVFDFTEVVPRQRRIRFVNSTYRKTPAIWNILSSAGKRVGVLGVPATYPPEKVNGFMVAGFDSPVCTAVDTSFVEPRELFPLVRDWRFADVQESHISPGWHERALTKLLAKIDDKERIARELLAREPWDFFMVVFGESDTIAHHFWLFHDPHSPRHREGPANAIRKIYERLDTTVGKLIEAAGDDVTIGIVSDHGSGGAGTGVVHLNNWLAEHGYLQFTGGGDSLLKQAALRLTPESWRGALFRRFQGLATQAESTSRFHGIDWSRTTAWSEELNYFPSIRVNLKGRDPDGVIDPEDYQEFCADLCVKLEAWEPIARAFPRESLYQGDHTDGAPDIILEFALEDGYSHSLLRRRGGPTFRRIEPHEYLGGKERGMTGSHRPTGVLYLSEPTTAGLARLEDIAPTILSRLGIAAPPMDGTSLFGDAPPSTPSASSPTETRAYTDEEEALIEGRLRDLGYFE